MKHSPGFERLVEGVKKRIREIGIQDIRHLLETSHAFHLIDVREKEEWERGRLPRAQHLCKGIIERDIESAIPNHDAEIVLYCGGGYRSALAADSLRQMGYTNVASMAGGWRGWVEAGYPTESHSRPSRRRKNSPAAATTFSTMK